MSSAKTANHYYPEKKNFILISKYLKEGTEFKLVKKDTLISNEYTYVNIGEDSFQRTKIKNKEYLYLSLKQVYQGTAVIDETVSFIMIDINSFKNYTLTYSGEITNHRGEAIIGEFFEYKQISENLEIKNKLYQFANTSKWVYHGSKDKNDYTNYISKWETDNNSINHLANGYSGIPDTIYSTYYNENLFDFVGNYKESQSIQNSNYKIVSYARGNIIALDKTKNLYFPIYTETCVTGCNKEIRFISKNSIEVVYSESIPTETSIIELDNIIFKN